MLTSQALKARLKIEEIKRPAGPVTADKRELIIEAATALFTRQGYEVTTVAQVAARAGVAVGTVYLYFGGKADLLYGVRTYWEASILQELDAAKNPELSWPQRLQYIVEVVFGWASRHSQLVPLLRMPDRFFERGSGEVETGRPDALHASLLQRALVCLLEEGIAEGALKPFDPQASAVLVTGMLVMALGQCWEIEKGRDQARYINALVAALNGWLLTAA
jgi:AcrR family transcriptional regulator